MEARLDGHCTGDADHAQEEEAGLAEEVMEVETSETTGMERLAIVVLGGSFCPPHVGHVAALEHAKKQAETDGFRVVAGYFAVAHDSHVEGKLMGREKASVGKSGSGRRGAPLQFCLGAEQRLELCNLVASTSEWLQANHRTYGSARECGRVMMRQDGMPPSSKVITVKGRDLPELLQSYGKTVSSSLVRETVQLLGPAKAVTSLKRDGILLEAVGDRLLEMVAAPR
mmetsp:Transcript_56425/g.132344  ORF Transcript_56425/g.132344 Transcript_56425/m.132344 type:complete len:227 (-) Transcript_56425:18-698(-)